MRNELNYSFESLFSVYKNMSDAMKKHPDADVMVSFASLRSAYESTLEAMDYPQIRSIAIIAEGIPENMTRKLIKVANEKNVNIIGRIDKVALMEKKENQVIFVRSCHGRRNQAGMLQDRQHWRDDGQHSSFQTLQARFCCLRVQVPHARNHFAFRLNSSDHLALLLQ